MKLRSLFSVAALCLFAASYLPAQDAAKTDPAHYKVVFENENVRVLHVHYGPHEKSVMHSHPAAVIVYLSDGDMHFTLPGGKTMPAAAHKDETQYSPATTHQPENMGDTPFDAVLVELKHPARKK